MTHPDPASTRGDGCRPAAAPPPQGGAIVAAGHSACERPPAGKCQRPRQTNRPSFGQHLWRAHAPREAEQAECARPAEPRELRRALRRGGQRGRKDKEGSLHPAASMPNLDPGAPEKSSDGREPRLPDHRGLGRDPYRQPSAERADARRKAFTVDCRALAVILPRGIRTRRTHGNACQRTDCLPGLA